MKKNELVQFLVDSRVKAGLTQGQVASELGYRTSQFISNWERGISCPPISSVAKLSKIYGVDDQKMFELIVKSSLEKVEASMREDFNVSRRTR